MILIGCDIGVTGGLAQFLGTNLIDVKDIPNVEIVTDAKGSEIRDLIGGPKVHKKHRLVPHEFAAVLREWTAGFSSRLIREDVHARGGQGAVSSGALMESVGLVDGICAVLGIQVIKVDPSTWKRAMGLTDDKGMSCQRAMKEFPKWASMFKRKTIDHDKAEAALLGLYAIKRYPLITS